MNDQIIANGKGWGSRITMLLAQLLIWGIALLANSLWLIIIAFLCTPLHIAWQLQYSEDCVYWRTWIPDLRLGIIALEIIIPVIVGYSIFF